MACYDCLALLTLHSEANKKHIIQEVYDSALADTQPLFAAAAPRHDDDNSICRRERFEEEIGMEEAALVALKTLYMQS